jgi:hypothetical protein
MALPKLAIPLYDIVCPSGLKVSFRPFLVKEEKLLMMAMQSEDATTVLNTSRQILENCVGEISGIDIDKLPLFDIEFLFLNLRARSIGEEVTLRYKCNNPVANVESGETASCNVISDYQVNLLEIKPQFAPEHSKYIQLTENVGITLRYPTFKAFRNISRKDLPSDEAFAFLVDCIESINDKNEVVLTKDVPVSEVNDFVNDLTHEQVAKMDAFFDTMPKVEFTLHFKCPKCDRQEDILVKGLDSFFV